MYGPVASWFSPYVVCGSASNFLAYFSGTGAVAGYASAPAAMTPPTGRLNFSTTVESSGVVMPEILVPASTPTLAPSRSP